MTMCTGISNVMKTDDVIFNDVMEFVDQNTTILAPYCQNVQLRYRYPNDSITIDNMYWLNINITAASTNINDDTQKYMNISEYFRYPYNTSLSIPNNELFLSFESFQFDQIGKYSNISFDRTYDNFYDGLEPTYFSLYLRQASLISLKPKISSIYSNSPIRRVVRLELNPRLEQLPINLESNQIQFGINYPSRILDVVETKEYACEYMYTIMYL